MASKVQLETSAEYPMKDIIDMVAGLPQTLWRQGTYAVATLAGDVPYSEEVWKSLLVTVRTSKDDAETDSSSGFENDSYEELLAPLSRTETALLEHWILFRKSVCHILKKVIGSFKWCLESNIIFSFLTVEARNSQYPWCSLNPTPNLTPASTTSEHTFLLPWSFFSFLCDLTTFDSSLQNIFHHNNFQFSNFILKYLGIKSKF